MLSIKFSVQKKKCKIDFQDLFIFFFFFFFFFIYLFVYFFFFFFCKTAKQYCFAVLQKKKKK